MACNFYPANAIYIARVMSHKVLYNAIIITKACVVFIFIAYLYLEFRMY